MEFANSIRLTARTRFISFSISVAAKLRLWIFSRLDCNGRDRDGGYFPASRQASKWPGVGHQTCLKCLPDCSSSAPPQIGQISSANNAEARASTFSPNWFRLSFLSEAD